MDVKKLVVAISGELGSGSKQIGQEVARSLKFNYYDDEILKLVAKDLGVDVEKIQPLDGQLLPKRSAVERQQSQIRDIPLSLVLVPDRDITKIALDTLPKFGSSPVFTAEEKERLTQDFHAALEVVMHDLANQGHAVIYGRGANFVLKNLRNVIKVFIHSAMPDRVDRLIVQRGITRDEAILQIADSDNHNRLYVHHFYEAKWNDPENYNLMLNLSDLPLKVAVDTICHYVREISHTDLMVDDLEAHRGFDRLALRQKYTVDDAAKFLMISNDSLLNAIRNGDLRAVVTNHRVAYIPRDELLSWLTRQKQPTTK
jgi:CMP/dCMP kinase